MKKIEKSDSIFLGEKCASGFMWAVIVQFHTSQEKSLSRLRKISVGKVMKFRGKRATILKV